MTRLLAVSLILPVTACRSHDAEPRPEPSLSAAPSAAAAALTGITPPVAPATEPAGVAPSEASAVAPAASAAGAGAPASNVATRPNESQARRDPTAPRASNDAPTATSAASAELPAAKAPSIAARRGAAATGTSYDTWLETTGGYAAGTAGSLNVVLNAKAPFKCNVQYPYKLALDPPPPGVSYPNAVVHGMHVDGKHASMAVPFTAASPGSYAVSGTLSFSTCTAEQCLVDKAHVGVTIEVR